MSVIRENREVLLKEIRVARVLPTLRKHLPEFLISDIENQLTIRRKNEKLLDILVRRDDGPKLLRMSLENTYPHLLRIFDESGSSEDENAPPRPPPPKPKTFSGTTPKPSDYRANKPTDYKPNTSAPKVMPKPKVSVTPLKQPPSSVTPLKQPPSNGIAPLAANTDDENRIKLLLKETLALKDNLTNKDKKIQDLENDLASKPSVSNVERDLTRLKTKYDNLEREKDMVLTEKLAMETEQSIILKENEFLKKVKSTSVSKRELQQNLQDKDQADQARDEAMRDSQRLRRELDELQRQYSDAVYAKDVREDEKRRESRDKSRIEKECEKLREELQEERKHAQKLSSGSIPISQYEKIQNDLDESRREARNLARERDTALQEKNTLMMDKKAGDSAEIRVLQDNIQQLNQQLDKIEADKNNIAFDNAMVTDQLNATTAQLDDATQERDALAEQNKLMGSDIEHLVKEREDILDELDHTKQVYTGTADEKDGTIRSLRQSLVSQQNITDTFEEKFNEADRKLIKIQEELKMVAKRESSILNDRDDFKRDLADTQFKLDKVMEERNAVIDDYDKTFKELEQVKKELQTIQIEKEITTTDHQQALEEIEKLHNHIAQLERGQPTPVIVPETSRPVESSRQQPHRSMNDLRGEDRAPSPSPAPFQPEEEDYIEDRDWRSEIKVIVLDKAMHSARTFGFTICGGTDNPHYKDHPEDSHIYVLKVQKNGVADAVLRPDDALLSVNGNDLSKVEHSYAVNTLKNSGECIELVIRRRFIPELIKTVDLSPYLDQGLGFSIIGGKSEDVTQDPGIYIAKVLPGGAAEAEGVLGKDDRLLTINGAYVVNVFRKDVENLLGNLEEQCVLRIAKPLSNLQYYEQADERDTDTFSQYGRRGKSTEDLRSKGAMSPSDEMFGPPATFRDNRASMNRAGSTPMLHDERIYQNNVQAPFDPLKRSSSHGHLRNNPDVNGHDLQRSRSQDWVPQHMMDPRSYAPSYAIRRITINRPNLQTSLGLEVYTASSGLSGIFVNKLSDKGGLSYRAGLRCADQILEVNGRNLRNSTHDEAVGILSSNVNLHLICQQSPKQFGEMHQTMRTGFFVRALFDFDSNPDSGLSFKDGDVLHIVDRESMEHEGLWLGLLLRGATAIQCGEIPSHQHALHIIQKQRLPDKDRDPRAGDKKGRKSLLSNVFKKDGRENTSQGSIDDGQYANDIIPYEPVQRKDLLFSRPIIILGPLTELLNDRLVNDCPEMFNRCILYTTRAPERDEVNGRDFWFVSQSRINEIQNGRDNDKFVECRHISGHTYYYSANAIKEVAKQNKHCVLNVGIHSIDRLHSVDLFPIVIFVKFRSAQDIREQFNQRCSIEQAQKVYEKAVKLERGFSDKFSATFSGSSMEQVFMKIKDYIRENASNIMWVRQN